MARKYKAQGSTVVPVRQAGGLTPVYDTATGKWKYETDPDSTKMEETLTVLDTIRADSKTAIATANTAVQTAGEAVLTANSKPSLAEVNSVANTTAENKVNDIFNIDYNGTPGYVINTINIIYSEDDLGWVFQVCAKKQGLLSGSGQSSVPDLGFCMSMGYVTRSEYEELEARIEELETRLAAAEKLLPSQKA